MSDIKYHVTQQNRITPDALTRLLDGVKILKKIKIRCNSAFSSWNTVDNFMQTIESTTKAHPDFDGIVAQRDEEARQRAAFIQRQKQLQQQKNNPPPPSQHYNSNNYNNNNNNNNYPPPPRNNNNPNNHYHNHSHNQYGGQHHHHHHHHHGPPPHNNNNNNHHQPGPYRGPPPGHPHHGHHGYGQPNHFNNNQSPERRTVYVFGFPRKWGYAELKYLFDCIGETEDVDVLKRKGDTAFVHYIYPADAREAVEQMNNSCPLYCKRPINVEMADKSRLGRGSAKSNVCWLYNQRTCQQGLSCSRQHICLFCNGNHPRKQCTEVDTHFRKLRSDQAPYNPRGGGPGNYGGNNYGGGGGGGGNTFRASEFEITIDDIPINAANERDLRLLFNSAGPITRIKIMKPRKRNMKVRAYMEFADLQSLNNALRSNGTILMGAKISVRKSTNNYGGNNNHSHYGGNYNNRGGSRYNNYSDRYNNNNNNNNNNHHNNNDRYNNNYNNKNNNNSEANREKFGEYMNSERMSMVNNTAPNRSRSRERGNDNNYRSGLGYNNNNNHNNNDGSVSSSSSSRKSRNRKKITDIGGCVTRGEDGKIIIRRKYRLKEVCTLFNGVTGCYSKDCEQIHVCSLCECEDHALPKCPRNGTNIGDILMKQIEQDAKTPGSAMLKIELKAKAKKRSHHDRESKDGQPPKKKIKLNNDNNNNKNNNIKKEKLLKPTRISQLKDIEQYYLLFLLDSNVWRRARVELRNGDSIKLHYLGWDSKYDETLSLKDPVHTKRLQIYKPQGFYTEATVNPQVRQQISIINCQKDVNGLKIEMVQKYLKACQLKNEGPSDLLRERLLNVTDEIKIIDAKSSTDIIEINMRRVDEEYFIKYPDKKKQLINSTNTNTMLDAFQNK